MKKLGIILLLTSFLCTLSCNSVSNLASTNSAGKAIGVACGQTLAKLYTQYKVSKTVDLSNSSNLLYAAELVPYYTALKSNRNDASYKKAFAAGLVTGSTGLVVDAKSMAVVSSLLSMDSLNDFSSSTLASSLTAKNIERGLNGLFKILN